MKVYIGPYQRYFNPGTIEDILIKLGISEKLAESICDKIPQSVFTFINDLRPRKIKVHIDNYDVWSADYTLSLIILPMLKKLKEQKHGCPSVDDEDVPVSIQSTSAPPKKEEWDLDDFWQQRWDYVLDRMINSFALILDDEWMNEFEDGDHDIKWISIDNKNKEVPEEEATLYRMEHGPNHTYTFDMKGYKTKQEEIQEGLRLFGKYYQALWD